MAKKNIWKLEYSITLFVLLGLLMLFVPVKIENYYQASLISKWNDVYNKVSYMFTVINAQTNDEILKSFARAKTPEQREKLLLQLVKPYLRIRYTDKFPRRYKPKYMNGERVRKGDYFYFNDLYFADKQIVGIKDIVKHRDNDPWFIMMFDINGLIPPNRWGEDIFGIYIFDEGKIQPFGYNKTEEQLLEDCSQNGKGVGCSYYYRIGGKFDD